MEGLTQLIPFKVKVVMPPEATHSGEDYFGPEHWELLQGEWWVVGVYRKEYIDDLLIARVGSVMQILPRHLLEVVAIPAKRK